MSHSISVIIVNYNAGLELIQCVQAVAETADNLEIIVVDNDSSDSSVQQLQDGYSGEKKLVVIQNDRNNGFAAACNQGSKAAGGGFFFYLNPDCIVEPETIPTLLRLLQSSPEIGMVGGLVLNHDGSEQRGCRRTIPTPWKSLVNSFGLRHLARFNKKLFSDFRLDSTPLPDKAVEVEAISGACMMISREAFEAVGPMDEDYFLHCEDLDWCMRFRQYGYKIMFVPQARLVHSKGSCSSSRPVFVEWSKHKGMVRFFKKFFAADYSWPMSFLIRIGIWLRFGLSLIKIFLRKISSMVRGRNGD